MSLIVPRFHLVSDRSLVPLRRLAEMVPDLVAAGIDAVHLREKDLPAGRLAASAIMLRSAIPKGALFLVNDRVDVALLSKADGVHLGEVSLTPEDARRIAGSRMLIGRSVHDIEGATRAVAGGADFLMAGNVFASRSKPGQPGRGMALIANLCAIAPIPVIAIGGVGPEHVSDVIDAGAHGIAVISGVLAASDPISAAGRYADELRRSFPFDDRSQG